MKLRRLLNRDIETAALDGKGNHETLWQALFRSNSHYKYFALALLAVVVWDRLQFYFLLEEKQYAPVVLAACPLDGTLYYAGEPDPHWQPGDSQVVDTIKRDVIQTLRGRTTDAQYDGELWRRLFARSTARGQQQLGSAYEELSHREAKGRITIHISSINKVSAQSWDVRWIERRHNAENILAEAPKAFRGVFQFVIEAPKTLPGWKENEKAVWLDGWSIDDDKGSL